MKNEGRSVAEFKASSWGFEKTIINDSDYRGRMLYIAKGQQTPLVYYRTAKKTIYVHSGKVFIYSCKAKEVKSLVAGTVEERLSQITIKSGDSFTMSPGTAYRLIAAEDSQVYEFSTGYDSGDMIVL